MNIDAGLATVLLFGSLFLVLVTGLPVVFVIGGLVISYTILLFGFPATLSVFLNMFGQFHSQTLLAGPLFIMMATVLQYSGIADDAYGMLYKWMGRLRGGLAMGTVIVCTIFAAMTGTSGAATLTMGLIAIPSMLKRGYNKHLATGCVATGGVLGIVIPPSIIMIIYGVITHESVGKLFMGGVIPGLVCSLIYLTYIGIRCWHNADLGPALPLEDRASWGEKFASLRGVILPLVLILLVLGVIYLGVATPTEAAAVGAFGAFICTAIHGKLSWALTKRVALQTLRLTAMVYWVLGAALAFGNLYTWLGAKEWLETIVTSLGVNPWAVLVVMQLSLFLFGCVMDDYAVVMVAAPIYVPIIKMLGFDSLWFGILFILNMQIAYLTPPYGFNLFFLRGITPQIKEQCGVELTVGDLYRSVAPFIPLQILGLALVMIFPQLALWLPSMMMK